MNTKIGHPSYNTGPVAISLCGDGEVAKTIFEYFTESI